MSKEQAKAVFKDGVTTWEEETMRDYTDVLYNDLEKSAIHVFYGNDANDHGVFTFTGGRTQYSQVNTRFSYSQKGNNLSRGNIAITVNKEGYYFVSMELQIMSNTSPQTLIGAQIYKNGSYLSPANHKKYVTNNSGEFNTINVTGVSWYNVGDKIQFGLITGGNQEIQVASYTSMTITEI